MCKKRFWGSIFALYVVFQALAVITFQFFDFSFITNTVLWTATLLLTFAYSIKVCHTQAADGFTSKHKKALFVCKVLLVMQVLALLYVILSGVSPAFNNNAVLSAISTVLFLPETILMNIFSNILYFLQTGIDFIFDNIYLDKIFLSVYPFVSITIFVEMYYLFSFRNKKRCM